MTTPPTPPTPTTAGAPAAGCVVLLVEDDPDIRALIGDILALEGYAVLTAGNGREALDVLASGARPCCILLDLMMPGMNGWEFRRAQRNDPSIAGIPVLLLTGAPPSAEHAQDLGDLGWLRKPIDIDELLLSVGKVVRRR